MRSSRVGMITSPVVVGSVVVPANGGDKRVSRRPGCGRSPGRKVAHVTTTPTELPARRGYPSVVLRAARHAKNDRITHLAQAIAFNGFLAIPSAMLLAI